MLYLWRFCSTTEGVWRFCRPSVIHVHVKCPRGGGIWLPEWTLVHLNGILARVGGNLNNNFQKLKCPGVARGDVETSIWPIHKLPIMYLRKAKTLFCTKFLKPYRTVCVRVKMVTLRPWLKKKKLNLEHQHGGYRFIVLGHQIWPPWRQQRKLRRPGDEVALLEMSLILRRRENRTSA